MGFDEVHRVRVGELPVAYREAGEGEPLLLVHGWPLSSRTWRKVVPELAKSARCIAIDLLQGLSRLPGSSALLRSLFSSKALAKSPVGFGLCFADLGRFDFDEFFEVLVASTARLPEGLRATRRFILDFDFADVDSARARYDRLAMPKLVIWGERDRIFPLRVGRRLAEMLPDPKRFTAIADAGLFVHEEQPGAWVEAVRSFLEETSAS